MKNIIEIKIAVSFALETILLTQPRMLFLWQF